MSAFRLHHVVLPSRFYSPYGTDRELALLGLIFFGRGIHRCSAEMAFGGVDRISNICLSLLYELSKYV